MPFETTCFNLSLKVHILWVILGACAPAAQLAVVVVAPALYASPSQDHARVTIAQGNGEGSEAC